jgi:rod shape-determining protein MreD
MNTRGYGNDPTPFGRLILLSMSLVVIDALFLSQLHLLGVRPLPFLLFAVIAGLELGSNSGTIAGFIAGVTADMFGVGRLGVWALICSLLGFAVGFARDHAFPAARERLPFVLIVGSSWIGVLSYVGITYIVDESPIPPVHRVAAALVFVALWNVVLGWPMRFVFRRAVGESLR